MAEATSANSIDQDNIDRESLQIDPAPNGIFVGDFEDFSQLPDSLHVVFYECDAQLRLTRLTKNTERVLGMGYEDMFGAESSWRGILFPDDRESLSNLIATLEWGKTSSAIHRILDKRCLPIWVCHGFTKALTARGVIVRGWIAPVSDEICTNKIDPAIIPQFVHKLGNHFQLINLLLGNLRAIGVPVGEIEKLQLAIDDTVELARAFLDYAQGPSCRSAFDVGGVLNAVIETMEPIFAEKKITLLCESSNFTEGTFVHGDSFLMEKAFHAVLENALDATSELGEVKIAGHCKKHRFGADESAHIVISDTGGGMEPTVLTRAAAEFFTTHRDRNGLGLSMALRIIEQHGGTMRINSAVGHGTQINIVLPIIKTSKLPIGRAE